MLNDHGGQTSLLYSLDGSTAEIKFPADTDRDGYLEQFKNFMAAIGFHMEGELIFWSVKDKEFQDKENEHLADLEEEVEALRLLHKQSGPVGNLPDFEQVANQHAFDSFMGPTMAKILPADSEIFRLKSKVEILNDRVSALESQILAESNANEAIETARKLIDNPSLWDDVADDGQPFEHPYFNLDQIEQQAREIVYRDAVISTVQQFAEVEKEERRSANPYLGSDFDGYLNKPESDK